MISFVKIISFSHSRALKASGPDRNGMARDPYFQRQAGANRIGCCVSTPDECVLLFCSEHGAACVFYGIA